MYSFHKPQILLSDLLLDLFIRKPAELLLSEFKEYFKTENIILLNSARHGISLALKAKGIGREFEVIVPSLICNSVPDAVLEAGAIPVFCDIESRGFNMDPKVCESMITEKTKAIVVSHLFGIPADMDQFQTIAKNHDLILIEDCAQSLGAEWEGKKVGTVGDFGVFSFGISKNISATGGGILVWKDPEMILTISNLVHSRNHSNLRKLAIATATAILLKPWIYGILRDRLRRVGELKRNREFIEFEGDMAGTDMKLVLRQFLRYERIMEMRNSNARFYFEKLEVPYVHHCLPMNCRPTFLYFPIVTENKEQIRKFLLNRGFETSDLNFNLVFREKKYVKFVKGNFPNLEKIIDNYLLLPLSHSLEIPERICSLLELGGET